MDRRSRLSSWRNTSRSREETRWLCHSHSVHLGGRGTWGAGARAVRDGLPTARVSHVAAI